jgi:transposase-like protein
MSDTPPDLRVVEAVPAVSENGRAGDEQRKDEGPLDPLEIRFVDMISTGVSMGEAATALDKSERTLRRWRQRPEIRDALSARMKEQMALAHAILASATSRAARELEKLCGTAEPATARIAACRAVVEFSTKLGEVAELETRLAALEERLAANDGGKQRWT